MKKPIDRLASYAKLASWTGFISVVAGFGMLLLFLFILIFRLKDLLIILPLLLSISLPFAAFSWFFWSLIRCPKCRTRLWALFFSKGKFFSRAPSETTCTSCKHDLSLPVK
jgi:hypothetical protein